MPETDRRLLADFRNGQIVAAFAVWVPFCVYSAFMREFGRPVVDMLATVALSLALPTACIFDSRLLGRPLVHAEQWALFVTFPFGFPAYLIAYRGWRGVLILIAVLTLAYATAFAVAVVSVIVLMK